MVQASGHFFLILTWSKINNKKPKETDFLSFGQLDNVAGMPFPPWSWLFCQGFKPSILRCRENLPEPFVFRAFQGNYLRRFGERSFNAFFRGFFFKERMMPGRHLRVPFEGRGTRRCAGTPSDPQQDSLGPSSPRTSPSTPWKCGASGRCTLPTSRVWPRLRFRCGGATVPFQLGWLL